MGNFQKAPSVQPIEDSHDKLPDYYDKWYHGGNSEARTNKIAEHGKSHQTRIRDFDMNSGWILHRFTIRKRNLFI